jgi:tol-pal system protein YbgF
VNRLTATAAALVLAAPFAARPAAAANKDMERLALQVATLQSQLTEVQRAAEESRKDVRRLTELLAEQNALLQRLAADRRQQDETVNAEIKELGERISELGESIQALRASGGGVPMPPAGPAPVPGTTAPGTTPATADPGSAPAPAAPAGPAPAPRELYSQAYADYARANFDLAIQGFGEYIRNYPGTDFTDNAQYWIGECLYSKKMYAEAIDAWNLLLRDYPSSDKIPDARVKKGMALERLGRKSQALVEYRYVVDRFPNSQAARLARERLTP